MAKARVYITLKPGLLDVQGKAVKNALETLGFKQVQDVRIGKYIEIQIKNQSAQAAKREVEKMCRKLLTNPVIEQYRIECVR